MKSLILLLSLLVASIAFATNSTEIRRGDRVLYGRSTGVVQQTFNNGLVQILFDGNSQSTMVSVSDLAKSMACISNLCNGRHVLYGSYAGVVSETFSNGTAKIKFDSSAGTAFVAASDLMAKVECVDRLCENTRVAYASRYAGNIVDLYGNGADAKARIKIDGNSSLTTVNVSDLSKGVPKLDHLRVEDKIVYGRYTGVVVELFENGTARIKFDAGGNIGFASTRDLGYAVDCLNTGDSSSSCSPSSSDSSASDLSGADASGKKEKQQFRMKAGR